MAYVGPCNCIVVVSLSEVPKPELDIKLVLQREPGFR
jgi:hypothetical protein